VNTAFGEGRRGDVKERDSLQDLSVYRRIILKRVLEKPDGKLWTELTLILLTWRIG